MSVSSIVRRPAVSMMTTSRPALRASAMPSVAIAGTGVPCGAPWTGISRLRPRAIS